MLPGISTEQLRSRLNRMVADGMLTRKRYREVPPRVDYELTERRASSPGARRHWPAGAMSGRGVRRARPRAIDISAIFRLIPGLVDRDSGQRSARADHDRRPRGRADLVMVSFSPARRPSPSCFRQSRRPHSRQHRCVDPGASPRGGPRSACGSPATASAGARRARASSPRRRLGPGVAGAAHGPAAFGLARTPSGPPSCGSVRARTRRPPSVTCSDSARPGRAGTSRSGRSAERPGARPSRPADPASSASVAVDRRP